MKVLLRFLARRNRVHLGVSLAGSLTGSLGGVPLGVILHCRIYRAFLSMLNTKFARIHQVPWSHARMWAHLFRPSLSTISFDPPHNDALTIKRNFSKFACLTERIDAFSASSPPVPEAGLCYLADVLPL